MSMQSGENGYPPIEAYALIGNCRTAALVSNEGSVDWLCVPRFDGASVFAALLDRREGGHFSVQPVERFQASRRYAPGTNVLETIFETASGRVLLRDLMPVSSEEEKRGSLHPELELLREVEGLEGSVEVAVEYEPRPGYSRTSVHLRERGELGIWAEAGPAAIVLRSDLPLRIDPDGRSARGRGRLAAGQRAYLSLEYSAEGPAVLAPLGCEARQRVERSARWWRDWSARCRYRGPHAEAVTRSALALKLMAFAPSGAVIAAPTTSLPERIGGQRNWDYRYCWLRDASMTLRALVALGYVDEAEAFRNWMLHATRLTWPELQVVYSVFGEAHLPESELTHLDGYRGSRPVRLGNAADKQLQLDVYGEVVDAGWVFVRRGWSLDRDTRHLLVSLGQTVARRWREPDDGIWEGRSGRQHHTHSKALCWVALDRLISMHEGGCIKAPVERFRAERDAIRAAIEEHGYDERLGSYVRTFGGDEVDAALLQLPLYGYVEADHPRMRGTLELIRERLGHGSLLYRYQDVTGDGLPPGEGAFGICGFWGVEVLARQGRLDEAERAFEDLLGTANDVGLLAEETDPTTGAALGNFPQAFTHVGLINAALTLARARTGAEDPTPAAAETAGGEHQR